MSSEFEFQSWLQSNHISIPTSSVEIPSALSASMDVAKTANPLVGPLGAPDGCTAESAESASNESSTKSRKPGKRSTRSPVKTLDILNPYSTDRVH